MRWTDQDYPLVDGFPGAETDAYWLAQYDGQKVSTLGLHLPARGDAYHGDPDTEELEETDRRG